MQYVGARGPWPGVRITAITCTYEKYLFNIYLLTEYFTIRSGPIGTQNGYYNIRDCCPLDY